MALPENRPGVLAILKAISPRVVGKPKKGWQCCCGTVKAAPGHAGEIIPSGSDSPGSELDFSLWRVPILDENGEIDWYASLDDFIPRKEVEALFARHFGENLLERSIVEGERYRLDPCGEARYEAGLGAAVSIEDHGRPRVIVLTFNWGADQDAARDIGQLFKRKDALQRLEDARAWSELLRLLGRLRPVVHIGGPTPALPFEPHWGTDFEAALHEVKLGRYSAVRGAQCSRVLGGKEFTEMERTLRFTAN